MILAARNAYWVWENPWKNPYITDGLISMWDGQWNVGGGPQLYSNGVEGPDWQA